MSSNSVRVRGTKHILVRGGDVPQRGQLGMGMEGRLSQVAQTDMSQQVFVHWPHTGWRCALQDVRNGRRHLSHI